MFENKNKKISDMKDLLKSKNLSPVKTEKIDKYYTPELHNALVSSTLKDKSGGIYLLCFRVLKKGGNIVIYNYIYYPRIFVNSLLNYLLTKRSFLTSIVFKEWGDYITILDQEILNDLGIDKSVLEYNTHFNLY